jgi:hypothetical protein
MRPGLPRAAVLVLGSATSLAGAGPPGPVTNSIGMRLVRVEPGTVRMDGALTRDTWEEQPAHDVGLLAEHEFADGTLLRRTGSGVGP